MDTSDTAGRLVYGLRVRGLDDVPELHDVPERHGVPEPPEVPDAQGTSAGAIEVDVRRVEHPGSSPARGREVTTLADGRDVMALVAGASLTVDHGAGTATVTGPALTPDMLAHPYLSAVATLVNRRHSREVFHGGAFVAGGRAWVLLGEREAGKSSLLAALAARGHPVVADDTLVTDGSHAFAGPRCVDLREPLPGVDAATYPARGATRSRLPLPTIGPRTPLGGWLFLGWGDRFVLRPVPAATLLARLAYRRALKDLPSDPAVLLALATRPAWELERPRDWAALDETCARLGRLPTDPATRLPGQRSPRIPTPTAGLA